MNALYSSAAEAILEDDGAKTERNLVDRGACVTPFFATGVSSGEELAVRLGVAEVRID